MFKLNFVTPDKKVVTDQELLEITVPAFAGELNILPGHAPLMTTLDAGILRYKLKNGESKKFAISWGYCQVSVEGVNVLTETALASDEIETKAVAQHLQVQEAKLATESMDQIDWDNTQHEVARLRAELALAAETRVH